MSRMIAYLWEDLNTKDEVKLGDHFVDGGVSFEEAVKDTEVYIRGSLARQKYKFDRGDIKIHQIWDVSEYAKKKGRFKKHAKIDDILRIVIGSRIQGDFHSIQGELAVVRINNELKKFGQPLPVAGLSTLQYKTACNLLSSVEDGKRTILAELCARFGKTIWAGAIAAESSTNLIIIASYVLTSFASFEKDLTSFEQFKDFEHIDTKDLDYQNKIKNSLKEGKKTIVYLSMCKGNIRQERINFLFGLRQERILIIDEADYGTHEKSQAEPLINARGKNDVVVLMTGTNGDRATTYWKTDHYIGVTYPELLIEKKLASWN